MASGFGIGHKIDEINVTLLKNAAKIDRLIM